MARVETTAGVTSPAERHYSDLQEHLEELKRRNLLVIVDRPINKDAHMHALVRWQFVGGVDEDARKAFLFTNVVDGLGRSFDIPVVIGALAANRAIYAAGMNCAVDEIQAKWDRALANPIPPRIIDRAPCHDVIETGPGLSRIGSGLDRLPIPISTPGFDSAPTLTATNVITRDPLTGVQNMGTYRAALKAPDRLVVRMATRVGGAGGYQHYLAHKERGDKEMPCAIVLGCPPFVAYLGPQKLPLDMDEMTVAGGLAGEPINAVRCHTVDLIVPAESELVIEGFIDVERVEPEAPFGESHGHVALEEFNMPMRVTAITHRRNCVIPSYISQVAPSESSVIKRVAYEPLFLTHLKGHLGVKSVQRVSLHEPLTGLLRALFVVFKNGAPRTEVWRALYGAISFKGDCGKICVALSDDIDPDNMDAVMWAIAYRSNPVDDVRTVPHRGQGHGPKREHSGEEDSSLLIDATMKSPMPPLALPKREYMEQAKAIWEELGLGPLRPHAPWYGYSLGDWLPQWDAAARRAVEGRYLENGRISAELTRGGLPPETKYRPG